jgi:hypothetical protein
MGHKRVVQDKQIAARGNPVAKHARTFNLAHTFEDRKAKSKRGHRKHKGLQIDDTKDYT